MCFKSMQTSRNYDVHSTGNPKAEFRSGWTRSVIWWIRTQMFSSPLHNSTTEPRYPAFSHRLSYTYLWISDGRDSGSVYVSAPLFGSAIRIHGEMELVSGMPYYVSHDLARWLQGSFPGISAIFKRNEVPRLHKAAESFPLGQELTRYRTTDCEDVYKDFA